MIFFSHRGNLDGPHPERENSPDYVDAAIACCFHVEVDLRAIGKQLFLGHDYPQYPVALKWFNARQSHLLVHIKNLRAAQLLLDYDLQHEPWYKVWNCFCHTSDAFTVTSYGQLWLHDLTQTADNRTIVPLISLETVKAYDQTGMYGVCTDFVNEAMVKFK